MSCGKGVRVHSISSRTSFLTTMFVIDQHVDSNSLSNFSMNRCNRSGLALSWVIERRREIAITKPTHPWFTSLNEKSSTVLERILSRLRMSKGIITSRSKGKYLFPSYSVNNFISTDWIHVSKISIETTNSFHLSTKSIQNYNWCSQRRKINTQRLWSSADQLFHFCNKQERNLFSTWRLTRIVIIYSTRRKIFSRTKAACVKRRIGCSSQITCLSMRIITRSMCTM